jgi:hypothetical protein
MRTSLELKESAHRAPSFRANEANNSPRPVAEIAIARASTSRWKNEQRRLKNFAAKPSRVIEQRACDGQSCQPMKKSLPLHDSENKNVQRRLIQTAARMKRGTLDARAVAVPSRGPPATLPKGPSGRPFSRAARFGWDPNFINLANEMQFAFGACRRDRGFCYESERSACPCCLSWSSS